MKAPSVFLLVSYLDIAQPCLSSTSLPFLDPWASWKPNCLSAGNHCINVGNAGPCSDDNVDGRTLPTKTPL